MSYKKNICAILMLLLCLVSFAACHSKKESKTTKENKTKNESVVVFTINGQKIFLDEVLYYVWQSEENNQVYYDSYEEKYKKSYWDSEIVEGTTVRDSLKKELYDTIVRDNLLYQKAKKDGITLTSQEKEKCKEDAKDELLSMDQEVKDTIGVTEEFLIRMKEKRALFSNCFSAMLSKYKVTEEDVKVSFAPKDYKQLDIQTIGYSKFDYKEDGTKKARSKELCEMGRESLQEIAKQAKTAVDFNDLLQDPSSPLESEDISIIVGDSACDKQIEETAMSMKPGETSDIIETDNGYYIIRLLSNDKEDAYEEAKNEAVTHKKYEKFDADYAQMKKDASIQSTDEWESIKVGGTVIKES